MNTEKELIVNYLLNFVTDNKHERMRTVLNNRTRHVTLVLEDIYHHHNASAVVRSAEIFGVQDLHAIEKKTKFKPLSAIAMGSERWLTVHHYKETAQCLTQLKNNGYRIIATTPSPRATNLFDLSIEPKIALLLGSEGFGLSQEALDLADECMVIPMYGFTESFNVSVSAALCLQHIITRLHQSNIDWRLSEDEKIEIMHRWLHKMLRSASGLEKEFWRRQSTPNNV